MAAPAFTPTPQPPPTTFAGQRGPNDAVSSKRLKADVSDTLLMTEPTTTPAAFMIGKLRERRTATQFEFTWLEMRPYPRDVTLSTNYAGGAAPGASVTLVFSAADAAKMVPNNVLRVNATGTLYLVVSVSGGNVTALANIGGSGVDAAITAPAALTILNTAYRDGADIGETRTVIDQPVSNFTQIFRTPYDWTGRQLNTEFFGGSDKDVIRKWAAVEHAKSLEHSLFFGKKALITDATSGKLVTFTGGLLNHIKTNVWDVNGNAFSDEAEIVRWLEYAMTYGDGGNLNGRGVKYFFASPRICSDIQMLFADKLRHTPIDKQYGLWCEDYESAHGTMRIVRTPSLRGNNGSFGFLVDMNHVRYVAHRGRDTKLYEDRELPGVDGEKEELMSDIGWQVEIEEAHSAIINYPIT
jgi:hypothetical protein